jgi:hypothetical protein
MCRPHDKYATPRIQYAWPRIIWRGFTVGFCFLVEEGMVGVSAQEDYGSDMLTGKTTGKSMALT